MKFNNKEALSFDDVLLEPQHSKIKSRLKVDTSCWVGGIKLNVPLIATNMTSITGVKMVNAMHNVGASSIFPRFFATSAEWSLMLQLVKVPLFLSIGVEGKDIDFIEYLNKYNDKFANIFIDVAHADCEKVENMIYHVRKYRHLFRRIIIGNIATEQAAKRFCKLGVHAIRVGIGGGAMCKTRQVTGHGIPTLQSVIDVYKVTKKYGVKLIADGGIRNSGDIIKCLAAGADAVCIGTLLASTIEAAGSNGEYNNHFGMSSKTGNELRGKVREGIAFEGKEQVYKTNTTVKEVIDELAAGIRSGLSYSGANTLIELRKKAIFRKITSAGQKESKF